MYIYTHTCRQIIYINIYIYRHKLYIYVYISTQKYPYISKIIF